jgi:hypothetical protein
VLRDACPSSSGTEERVSEITWTAGSAFSVDAGVDGIGRLDITMRRSGDRAVMMGTSSQ